MDQIQFNFCIFGLWKHLIYDIAGFRSPLWDACQSKNAAELTPKYPDFISERVYALHAAARWWFEYRNEVL